MIIETIFSTIDEAGNPNFAPMGITLTGDTVRVKPYLQTQTCRNLLLNGIGVANFSDDVLAYVQCGLYDERLRFFPAKKGPGFVFQDTCFWWELEIISKSESGDRLEAMCCVVHKERQKEFLGFCRAKNAVIEAAILASRSAFIEPKLLMEMIAPYREIVEKTGSEREFEAFRLVWEFIQKEKVQ